MFYILISNIITLYREKERTTREYLDLAKNVHEITQRYEIPLIIYDRVDVALAVDAEGVHVGQTDMPVAIARKLMGNEKIVGATTKTVPIKINAIGGLNKDNINVLKDSKNMY